MTGTAQHFAARFGEQVALPWISILRHGDQDGRLVRRLNQLAIGTQAGRTIKNDPRSLSRPAGRAVSKGSSAAAVLRPP